MAGGPPKREALLVGLKSGAVVKVFIDNPFPIPLVGHGAGVRCLDVSAARGHLAVVDEHGKLSVYDLNSKVGSPPRALPDLPEPRVQRPAVSKPRRRPPQIPAAQPAAATPAPTAPCGASKGGDVPGRQRQQRRVERGLRGHARVQRRRQPVHPRGRLPAPQPEDGGLRRGVQGALGVAAAVAPRVACSTPACDAARGQRSPRGPLLPHRAGSRAHTPTPALPRPTLSVQGSKVFCLQSSAMQTIDVPLSAPMFRWA